MENVEEVVSNKEVVSNTDNYTELEKEIKKNIEKKLYAEYVKGLMTGWNTCAIALYNHAKDMTSAKKIIKYLKKEKDEAMVRSSERAEKSEPTP